ncbi:hypothetical protein ACOMHN_001131 [Nucella lapillus]
MPYLHRFVLPVPSPLRASSFRQGLWGLAEARSPQGGRDREDKAGALLGVQDLAETEEEAAMEGLAEARNPQGARDREDKAGALLGVQDRLENCKVETARECPLVVVVGVAAPSLGVQPGVGGGRMGSGGGRMGVEGAEWGVVEAEWGVVEAKWGVVGAE